MLATVGAAGMAELVAQTVPASIRLGRELAIDFTGSAVGEDREVGEAEATALLRAMAARNRVLRSYLGLGYHGTITPGVIRRNILENPGWYTQYTPYQAEISQGRLEALLNFQTMIADLTAMPVANASLLDEATAAAEAMHLAAAVHAKLEAIERPVFFVAADCHPQTIEVVRTRARPVGIEVFVGDPLGADFASGRIFGVLVQYPATDGRIRDYARSRGESARGRGDPDRGLRPAGADAAAAAGRVRRRRRGRLDAALRRADGLRRAACRLHVDARRVQAADAGTADRRLARRARQSRLPHVAADPRAAHSPREGDLQHLHRPGAAGDPGGDVRGVPRPRRAAGDRRADARAGGGLRGRRAAARAPRRGRAVLRHRGGRSEGRRRRGHRRAGARRRDQHPPARHRHGRGRLRRDGGPPRLRRPARRLRRGGSRRRRAGARGARGPAGAARADERFPLASGLQPLPHRARDAALHPAARDARPLAGAVDDLARLVHHEAQRHRRDGADHLARARRTSTRSRRSTRPTATSSSSGISSAGWRR